MQRVRHAKALGLFILMTTVGSLTGGHPAQAQAGFGDITVTPTRIVLEGRTRSGTISLANTGAKKATYRISVVNMRMTETGAFEEVPEGKTLPGEQPANELFRYAPRQVTLEPGESQTIRIAVRKPAGLAQGEYRSHLLIRAVPTTGAGRSIEQKSGNGVEISLAVIPGVALPVIIRQGDLSAQTSLSGFSYEPAAMTQGGERASLTFRLNRTGTKSVYGDLEATYFAPGSDEGLLVSQVNQLAVYTPNDHRIVTMPLTIPEGIELKSGGKIVVSYRTPPKEGGKVIGTGEYRIP
jgi:P pilus assembly chaperone PapD